MTQKTKHTLRRISHLEYIMETLENQYAVNELRAIQEDFIDSISSELDKQYKDLTETIKTI